jgi:hypothetical protein
LLRDGEGLPLRGGNTRRPSGLTTDYGDTDRENAGIEVLRMYVEARFGSTLHDCRGIQGHGADAKDDGGRFFELKAHGGARPEYVTMTPHEFERALRERTKYYLAVVAGLEKGHQTTLTLVQDPVTKLSVHAQRELVVSGLRAQPEEVFTEEEESSLAT